MARPGPNTQSAKHAAFTSVSEIKKHRTDLLKLIVQAIQNERDGRKVNFRSIDQHPVPMELKHVLDERSDIRAAFSTLTAGRQRGYLMHIGSAKQHATCVKRVEACIPSILAGKGLTDR